MKKNNLFIPFSFYCSGSLAQSPFLSVKLMMDTGSSFRYKIKMKFCSLKNPSERSDLFSHETSKINFDRLTPDDVDCGDYFTSDEGIVYLLGQPGVKEFNGFEYSGQSFPFEKILVFEVLDYSHGNRIRPMYIVLPVKNKSFATFIELTGINFEENKVLYLDSIKSEQDGIKLFLKQSLADKKGILTEDFSLKGIL